MGLIKKILGRPPSDSRPGATTLFEDSESPEDKAKSRNAPRRELVHVVLRETMRKHGIPSDWIESRSLSTAAAEGHKSGMHVQFLVHHGDQQLLPYVHAFQESFRSELLRMDPTSRTWLLSVGWEFYGKGVQDFATMPDAAKSKKDEGPDTESLEGDSLAPQEDDDLAGDLQALKAVIAAPAEPKDTR